MKRYAEVIRKINEINREVSRLSVLVKHANDVMSGIDK